MPWIYKYIDAAMNEPEMGPYDTYEECEKHSKKHASFGAMTSPPEEVSDIYKPYKPDYDLKKPKIDYSECKYCQFGHYVIGSPGAIYTCDHPDIEKIEGGCPLKNHLINHRKKPNNGKN